jgi:hypothetical protein
VGARQARLRREYAPWYPTIAVASWIRASTVARAVARQLLERGNGPASGPRWEPGARILDDRHFEFRGGLTDRDPAARIRVQIGELIALCRSVARVGGIPSS